MDILKSALLGTENYHELMRRVAAHNLQKQSGYIPAQMPLPDSAFALFPPMPDNVIARAKGMMVEMSDSHHVCLDPRIPYLFIAWLFIGKDSPCRFTDDKTSLVRRTVLVFLRVALGMPPSYDEVFHVYKRRGVTLGPADIGTYMAVHDALGIVFIESDSVVNGGIDIVNGKVAVQFDAKGGMLLREQSRMRRVINAVVGGNSRLNTFSKRDEAEHQIKGYMHEWISMNEEMMLKRIRQMLLELGTPAMKKR